MKALSLIRKALFGLKNNSARAITAYTYTMRGAETRKNRRAPLLNIYLVNTIQWSAFTTFFHFIFFAHVYSLI
ncbi:MAG: hypothetical protein AAB968_01515, partial [Patescibacteria group bacterium]